MVVVRSGNGLHSAWWPAPLHFLHNNFVVGQHHNAKTGKLPVLQPGDEIGKGSIEGSNTIGEAEPVGEKAAYYLVGVVLVSLHAALKYQRSPRQKLAGKITVLKPGHHRL
jgi:hypothetical protein